MHTHLDWGSYRESCGSPLRTRQFSGWDNGVLGTSPQPLNFPPPTIFLFTTNCVSVLHVFLSVCAYFVTTCDLCYVFVCIHVCFLSSCIHSHMSPWYPLLIHLHSSVSLCAQLFLLLFIHWSSLGFLKNYSHHRTRAKTPNVTVTVTVTVPVVWSS